ncbi:hypothetical protein F8388_019718 [Cannabis sativa]|uniref:Uncharacterized protein n=1 Tax=Cannabis sativa TaxID=3483 RepID=A0A7J6DWU2_CANSA|nr:hypothetical protein F8388_019718 [Cannabis sativa]
MFLQTYLALLIVETGNSLGAGGDIRVYLEKLSAAEDVQKFVEQNPFGQMLIRERPQKLVSKFLKHLGISVKWRSLNLEKKKCKDRAAYASLLGVGAPEALVIGVVAFDDFLTHDKARLLEKKFWNKLGRKT